MVAVAVSHSPNTGSNNLLGAVALNSTGNVTLVNGTALTLAASTFGAGTLSLTSAGSMSQSGAIAQTGAGAITLASSAALASIDLSGAANNLLGTITFGGTLSNIQDVGLRNINSSAALPDDLTVFSLRNLNLQFDSMGITLRH